MCRARSAPPFTSAPNCSRRPSSSPTPDRRTTARMHRPAKRRRHSPITMGRNTPPPLSSPMPRPLLTAIRTYSLRSTLKSTAMLPAKYSTKGFTSDTRSFLYRKLSKPLTPQAVWSFKLPRTCSIGHTIVGPSGPPDSIGAKSSLKRPSGTHSSVEFRRPKSNATSCQVFVAALPSTSDFSRH